MRLAATFWLLWATASFAQVAAPPAPLPQTTPQGTPQGTPPAVAQAQDDARRRGGGGGGEDAAVVRPDLSADFDAFSPDSMPPPRRPRFDPRRPSLAAEADPLAALIRNGPSGAVLSASPSPEPWMLPGTRRVPTLADPPPGSAPATKPSRPSAPAG